MATDSVIVQHKDGSEFEVESAAIAKRVHPDAKIVRFARTGEPYKDGAKATAVANPPVETAFGGELATHVDESSGVAKVAPATEKDKA